MKKNLLQRDDMNKYLRLFNTIKYMKIRQINYRLFYIIRSKYRKFVNFSYPFSLTSSSVELKLQKSIDSYNSFSNDNSFSFLNLSHKFEEEIDWNFIDLGKLWAYNLNYFEYLNQKNFEKEIALKLIDEFIDAIETNNEGLEPFPTALRGINWVKFLTFHQIKNQKIDDSLYAQYMILMDNLEYHLLGNHLLENGFSLLFGAYYFNDAVLYEKAKEILVEELKEQILDDGAHFELTPMYHQIMLFRVLDCLNLVKENNLFEKEFEKLLNSKAQIMLGWLKKFSYQDGTVAHFNDSTEGIAPTSNMLFKYALELGIDAKEIALSDSGYRAINYKDYELRVDVAEIGPSYIPGHAHSDTFNFELRLFGKPFIVDTGISTYENNKTRINERQTQSHNTVKIGNKDQSCVWSSFRVANRARINFLNEQEDSIVASHDGYKKLGIIHQRRFKTTENSINIKDLLIGNYNAGHTHVAYIHFHPTITDIKLQEDKIIIKDIILSINGSKNFKLDDFTFANGFNKLESAKVLKITFDNKLFVNISLN